MPTRCVCLNVNGLVEGIQPFDLRPVHEVDLDLEGESFQRQHFQLEVVVHLRSQKAVRSDAALEPAFPDRFALQHPRPPENPTKFQLGHAPRR